MATLQAVFEKARSEDRAALVGYLPAGFPSKDGAIAAATAMVEAGCDVIEVGLPYSDPLMDGPTIQDAVHRSLTNGTRIADVLRTVEGVARSGAAALVIPIGLGFAFWLDARTNIAPGPTITFIQSWPASRTEAETRANIERVAAEKARRDAARQRDFQAADNALSRIGL